MDDQTLRYAEEMMRAHQRSKASGESLEAKLIRLNNALAMTSSRCISPDYCPQVTTQKGGIIGRAIVLTKRLARKATFFIVKDLAQEIAGFQTETVNVLGGIIALQEDILIELIQLKQNAALKKPVRGTGVQEKTRGDHA
jgi:hypothetical protein